MRVASYYVIDPDQMGEWTEFKTKSTAFRAAQEVRDAGTYEPVVVKVIKEKAEDIGEVG